MGSGGESAKGGDVAFSAVSVFVCVCVRVYAAI